MLENNAIRAIMIGVGVFVILLTLTAVVTYVNIAKDMATTVNKGINEWDEIDIYNIMDYSGNVTIDVTGMDLINFIRRYVDRGNIRIKLGQFTDTGDPNSYEDIGKWMWEPEVDYITGETMQVQNASARLMNINPNAKLKMTKQVLSDDTIQITVLGDIWIIKQAEVGINYGDVDSINGVNPEDYYFLKEYIEKVFSEEEREQADVNGDGIVNYSDRLLLREYLSSGAEIKPGTGDVVGNDGVNNQDLDFMKKYILSDVQRESADINLDRIVNNDDLNKLKEKLIEEGYTITEEDAE